MSSLPRKAPHVLSLRLPSSVLAQKSGELLEVCEQYGTVLQSVMDLYREQLLVELDGEFNTLRLMNDYRRIPLEVGGCAVKISAATRQEMTRARSEVSDAASATKKPLKTLEFNSGYLKGDSTSTVLCAHVDKETVEVTHDILRQAFSKYGRVTCLISFRNKGTLHCLVEYPDVANSAESLRKLNGIQIYDDCCVLQVCFSNLSNLVFKDDGRGYTKLVHHNLRFELSSKNVSNLQVWYPSSSTSDGKTSDGVIEQDRTKAGKKPCIANGSARIPKIPKLGAVQSQARHKSSDAVLGTHVSASSKGLKPTCNGSRLQVPRSTLKNVSKNSQIFTGSKTSLKWTEHHQQSIAKPSSKVPPLTDTFLPSPKSLKPPGESKTVESARTNLSKSVPEVVDKCLSSDTIKSSRSDIICSSGNTERVAGLSSNPEMGTFTLSLDPSDCSDIEMDALTPSSCASERYSSFGCQTSTSPPSLNSVQTAVGCQQISLPSVATQCHIQDEELMMFVTSCRDQLAALKEQCADIGKMESQNKELLQENANLKNLLVEVQDEMKRLKEIITRVPVKLDASIQVDCNAEESVVQVEVQGSAITKCDKAQQTIEHRSVTSPIHSAGSFVKKHHRKRSLSCHEYIKDTTHGPSKKKRKKKSKSLSLSPSSLQASCERTISRANGYTMQIRNKLLYTHLQSFLKSQEFVKSKLDLMKEATTGNNASRNQALSKILPQFEHMYSATVELANLQKCGNECGNEEDLFTCIKKLSALFPSLIASLSESMPLKLPGVSLTILSVLRKMGALVMEMCKFIPQSKTLAVGNTNTGETTLLDPSSSNDKALNSPPPLLLLGEAINMLNKHEPQQNSVCDEPPAITSLIVSISTKLLRNAGGKRLFSSTPDSEMSTGNVKEMEGTEKEVAASPDLCSALHPVDAAVAPSAVEQTSVEATDISKLSSTVMDTSTTPTVTSESPVSVTACTSLRVSPPSMVTSTTRAIAVPPPCLVGEDCACSVTTVINDSVAKPLPASSQVPLQSSATPIYSNGYVHSQPNTLQGSFRSLLTLPHVPIPIINISQSVDGLVVKWTLNQLDFYLAPQVSSYSLCAFQGDRAPSPEKWQVIGEVRALSLPMACTLTHFIIGHTYHFAVRANTKDGVCGQFSDSKAIQFLG